MMWVTLKIQDTFKSSLVAKTFVFWWLFYSITFNILSTPHFTHNASLRGVLGSSQVRDLDRLRKGSLNFLDQLLFAVTTVQFWSESSGDSSRTACAGEIRWLLNLSDGQHIVNEAGVYCKQATCTIGKYDAASLLNLGKNKQTSMWICSSQELREWWWVTQLSCCTSCTSRGLTDS